MYIHYVPLSTSKELEIFVPAAAENYPSPIDYLHSVVTKQKRAT